ncbi:MAG TPA: hypothetical protein VE641_07860, partial [Chthoniobacterales bacterium]|nr:hypothetical protein [Chthoniobacterales bacterium]
AWVLVLGRYGWAPLDLLDLSNPSLEQEGVNPTATPKRQWFDPASQRPVRPVRQEMQIPLSGASFAWTLVCLLTASLSFLVCGRFVYLRGKPNVRTWSSFCSVDLSGRSPISRPAHARYVCLAGCLSSLTFLNGLVLVPMLDHDWGNNWVNWGLRILVGAATAIPLLTQCYLIWEISNEYRKDSSTDCALTRDYVYAAFVIRIVLLLLPVASLLFWYRLCFYDGVRGSFFRFRVFSLDFLVSPIWPCLFATAGLFIVALFHLRRLTWASRQRPLLETSTLDRSLWGQLGEINDALHRVFSGPAISKPGVRIAGVFAVVGVFIALVLVFPQESLRSFEPIAFEFILIALFLPLSLLVATGFARFAVSWHTLRRLLSVLNSLDVARYFKQIPDFNGSGPIWVRDLRMTSLATSVNSAIALHNLSLTKTLPQVKAEDYWNPLSSFLSASNRKQLISQYRNFTLKAADINRIVSDKVLLPFWQTEKLRFVEAGTGKKEERQAVLVKRAAAGAGSHSVSAETGKTHHASAESYEMASEYVALQFSVFIGYALRHIQNLLLCSVFSFVLLVLALNSFSFQTPEAISRLVVAGLIIGGIVVVRALAQMERNPIISRLSGTEEGALGKDFYLQIVSYGALPVLTVIATQFPSVARLLTFWVQPTVSALK